MPLTTRPDLELDPSRTGQAPQDVTEVRRHEELSNHSLWLDTVTFYGYDFDWTDPPPAPRFRYDGHTPMTAVPSPANQPQNLPPEMDRIRRETSIYDTQAPILPYVSWLAAGPWRKVGQRVPAMTHRREFGGDVWQFDGRHTRIGPNLASAGADTGAMVPAHHNRLSVRQPGIPYGLTTEVV